MLILRVVVGVGSTGLNLRARSGGGFGLRRLGGFDGFGDFDAEDVTGAEHVAGEEDVFFVGGEADVGFGAVVVVGHVDEVLGFEDAGLAEVGAVEGAFALRDHLGVEELDPFAVGGLGYLAGVAAVAGEEVEVLGEVEVNGPLVALHVVGGASCRSRGCSWRGRSLRLWGTASRTRWFCRRGPRTRGRRSPWPWCVCG